ncbi:MAG: tetratricopeptide repeat protein [Limnospira sp.]
MIDTGFKRANLYYQSGCRLMESGQLAAAESEYRKAITVCPDLCLGYLGLGGLFLLHNQTERAIATYEEALEKTVTPELLEALGLAWIAGGNARRGSFYLASAAHHWGEYEIAVQHYREFLQNRFENLEVSLALADCYQKLNRYPQAIAIYRDLIRNLPAATEPYIPLMAALQEMGQIGEANATAETALKQFPNHIPLKFAQLRLLPLLYKNPGDAIAFRQQFERELNALIATTPIGEVATLKAVGDGTNFYLQYQGDENLFTGQFSEQELQRKYGEFVHRVMVDHYPDWGQPPVIEKRGTIRVGYVCSFFQWHTVGNLFLGWVKELDRDRFEVYCYYTGRECDRMTELYKWYADRFYHIPNDLEKVAQTIHRDRLDVLVFLELGMCPQTLQLAGLRLAPVQCVTWGHPVTSGFPTVDYFISAELLESPEAQNYYSEKLIRLPHLGISIQPPQLPEGERRRSDWDFSEDAILYLSCQSLFKYLPKYDIIYGEIAHRVPRSQFVFIAHWNSEITEQFRDRLYVAFRRLGLRGEDYCIFLPRLDYSEYLQLHTVADIGLDTFQFTGFATTLDAIACGLPIVTHEGNVMRARQSAGILRRLGITEAIAKTEAEYVEIAVELGLDSEKREAIVQKIRKNQSRLYNDLDCIRGLERVYTEILQPLKNR